ncbi:MAG: hypothetical protein NVS2B8_10840 [Vulcanimicrobiaceae bacterium]
MIRMLPTLLASAAFAAGPLAAQAAPNAQDIAFAKVAARGGMAEVTDATLAAKHSTNPVIKAFAAKMLADHGKANVELAAIARARNIALPSDLGPVNTKMKGTLEGLHGKTFDSAYLQGQRQSHVQTAALFRKEIATGSDPKLVAFAKRVLPTVDEHLALDATDLTSIGSATAPGIGKASAPSM